MYKPRRGGAGHVVEALGAGSSALKMLDNQSSLRDYGTVPRKVGRLASMQVVANPEQPY